MKFLTLGAVCVSVMAVVLLAFSASVQAAPSVSLNGNLYVYATDYETVSTVHQARVARLPWAAGTAGALTSNFFSTPNQNTAADAANCRTNFDIYNHNVYLGVVNNDQVSTQWPTVWKVDGTTGAPTKVFVATNADAGAGRTMAVDDATGDIYFSSRVHTKAARLHDGPVPDGDYNDAGEETALSSLPTSLWTAPTGSSAGINFMDAEFYGGWMYFSSQTGTRDATHLISRLQATPGVTGSIVATKADSLVGGWPTDDTKYAQAPYLAVGDPDKDQKVDMYALITGSNYTYNNTLVHWEDTGDGFFSASELIDSVVLTNPRDIELVTDGTHSMIVYLSYNGVGIDTVKVNYVSLLDDGSIDAANQGTLFTTDLAPSNANSFFVFLKMDQITASGDVPEPATLLLLGTGALGAFGYIRRQRMK